MKQLSGSEVREAFLRFFEEKGHRRVHSSSLVPANDPTLLFTNAGMNQFKDVFLGIEKRDYLRATTSQKCVRAGGKHNDLENVGFTNRHHTFFEMLGNFSFGDYFKQQAIALAWELIAGRFAIPQEKLYVTIFKGEGGVPRDHEAHDYWIAAGVVPERIYELGKKDNFWEMGETGPCGPCSEIHYDMGAAASDAGHTDCKFGCDCGRYVEIWNLVFMQFDHDAEGRLTPLPKPCVDTGMGLERISAVLQGVISNYDTDLFTPLIKRAAELTNVVLDKELKKEEHAKSAASLRVIADHARCATFLISDGVLPTNDGRGYVLRKILRRGIRHGRLLGQDKPFMHEMVHAVRDEMKGAYPELVETAGHIVRTILSEENRFAHTISVGLQRLDELIEEKKRWLENTSEKQLARTLESLSGGTSTNEELEYARRRSREVDGRDAFRLYETYGLPRDFIEDACRDAGVAFDAEGFEKVSREERERARASWKGGSKASANPVYRELAKTQFLGYTHTRASNCAILAITREGAGVPQINPGEEGEIVLDHTPFYADSGGQVGDHGWFYSEGGNVLAAVVQGCVLPVQGVRAHKVAVRQTLRVGDKIDTVVDPDFRESTVRNHTGTHLLHAALREILGKHVKQAGSLVDPQRLRFDFSHFTSLADEELQDIEDLANKEILKNTKVGIIEDVPIETAINEYKAMALFGEKYGDKVRVVKIGDFSTELCGGIHNSSTGEIGLLKILSEGSVSSGVRRVEAVTGVGSLHHFRRDHELEHLVSALVRGEEDKTPAQSLRVEWERREEEIRRLRKELEQARMKSAASSVASAGDKVREVKGIKVLAQRVDNLERGQMRTLVDNLRTKLGSGVVVLGSAADGKVALIAGVTKDLTGRVQAGKIVGEVTQRVGGSGGGRPDMAEAGGKNPAELDNALSQVPDIVAALAQ